MNLIFALAFIPDKILGLIPAPYLLQQDSSLNYSIYKRLTGGDIQSDFVTANEWAGTIIELSGSLAHAELNKKFNKKYAKTNLIDFFKDADEKTLKYLQGQVDNIKTMIVNIVREYQLPMFIKVGHMPAIYLEEIIEISDQLARVIFEFEKRAGNLYYRLKLFHEQERVDLVKGAIKIITNKNAAIVYRNKLIFFENPNFNGNKLKPFLKKEEIVVSEKMQGVFFKKFIAPVVKNFDYKISGFEFTEITTEVKSHLLIEKTFTNEIVFTPEFWYLEHSVVFYKEQEMFVTVVEKEGTFALESISRDFDIENSLLNKLTGFGLKRKEKYFSLNNSLTDIYKFTERFAQTIQKIEETGFKVINRLFNAEVNYAVPVIDYETKQKQDWFDLYIVITVGEFKIKFEQLKYNILNHIREFTLPDGGIFIIPETWFTELYPLAKRTNDSNESLIHKTQLQLLQKNKLLQPDKIISGLLSKLEINGKLDLPKEITAKLRDYQKTGFHWLYHLTQNRFGVCLADDMGLGKTLQVIVVLQKYFENKVFKDHAKSSSNQQLSLFDTIESSTNFDFKPVTSALLIVPRSLIFNWIEELRKFAPQLTYTVYHGSNRQNSLRDVYNNRHIIITTYGIVRQDIDDLKTFRFSYLIADESQAIKNPQSKTFKSITVLQSDFKIAITGTPIENSLTDLWAQMSFLNKNMLGNLKYFEETYALPISKDPGGLEATELKNITGSFVLRRLKKDVAKELPQKIEQVIYCELAGGQKEFYETEKSSIRNRILFTGEKDKNVINALAMLNRLRQIAIHPLLVDEGHESFSGKFESIINTMDNLMEQGHKFLVFSSFVKHLNLFKKYFKNTGVSYSMLTGSDQNRQEIVEEYQNNSKIKPFLISIKAGGLGLNITAANYVLIVDPWWNPFVELQAIDRTHRIGQTQKVVVYRFITKDSVEEKMMMLQKSKLELSDSLINQNNAAKLKLAEIEKLLD